MESTSEPSPKELTSLLEHTARRLHSQGYAAQLFPAQWAALRYLSHAEPNQRTAIDLARAQGLAAGAVARTVRTLVTKGYVEKAGSIGRGRAEQLDLTARGRALLKKDPLERVTYALKSLGRDDLAAMARGLQTVIAATMPGEKRQG